MISHNRPRRGSTVAEVLVGALLGMLLLQMSLAALSRAKQIQRDILDRGEMLNVSRLTRWVMRAELGAGRMGADWSVHAPDSLTLRAFRGVAVVCSTEGTDLMVSFRGQREPNAAKDSLLLISSMGTVRAVDLVASRKEGTCSTPLTEGNAPWVSYRWDSGAEIEDRWVVARLFEAGSYHIHDAALRYRQGRSGRQPLTPAVIVDSESGFWTTPGGVDVLLRARVHRTERNSRISLVPGGEP